MRDWKAVCMKEGTHPHSRSMTHSSMTHELKPIQTNATFDGSGPFLQSICSFIVGL